MTAAPGPRDIAAAWRALGGHPAYPRLRAYAEQRATERKSPTMTEPPFPEPFGPDYVRPEGPPCPDCACCTARLCEAGREVTGGCGHVGGTNRDVVLACPCGTAPGSVDALGREVRDVLRSIPESRRLGVSTAARMAGRRAIHAGVVGAPARVIAEAMLARALELRDEIAAEPARPPYPEPGSEIPDQPGYVVGTCQHRVAASEWRAGCRTCERC
jgi:hypothetical protein